MEAVPGNNISWAWRSILKGLDVVRMGARKQIRSGRNTSICYDPWLPSAEGFRIQNPDLIPQNISVVADLIDEDTNWWKTDLLPQVFEAADVQKILSLELGNRSGADLWWWHHNKSGRFSVKSAYHMLVESPGSGFYHQDASALHDRQFWNRFWCFRVPQRAKHFAWRLLTDSLPTSANLRARTMDVPLTCPLCQFDGGTSLHLFFDCQFARRLWSAAGLTQIIDPARRNRGEQWFKELLLRNDARTAELILMLCDGLWMQRNSRLFTDRKLGPEYLASSVSANLRSFQNANQWPERTSEVLGEHSLLRPLPGGTRVLFDAGIKDGNAGVGVVALQEDGTFIQASAETFLGITDPTYAEGLALRAAIDMADDLGLEAPALAGDCLNLVRMVRELEPSSLGCVELVGEIRALLLMRGFMNPFWIPRDRNIVAHSLASFAKNGLDVRRTWDTAPEFLLSNDSGRFPVT
jgi:hypothetical protein